MLMQVDDYIEVSDHEHDVTLNQVQMYWVYISNAVYETIRHMLTLIVSFEHASCITTCMHPHLGLSRNFESIRRFESIRHGQCPNV